MAKLITPKPLFDTLENTLQARSIDSYLADKNRDDFQLTLNFIYSYRGSEATYNAYRRELERFLHWVWSIAKKQLPQIRRQDIEKYVEFCQSPPEQWIGYKNCSRFITQNGQRVANSEWRPFVGQKNSDNEMQPYILSQKGLQAIFAVLSSFFNYLIQEEYIDLNPVLQIRQKSKYLRKHQSQPIIRRLSELQWSYVIETAEIMAKKAPDIHERTLFVMNALYGMYLRVSELVATARWVPQMGDFFRDMDGNWWFRTVGKGNKERMIAVSDAMLDALQRYRLSLGLPALPTVNETRPLLQRLRGVAPINSTRQVRQIVQNCFDQAIDRLAHDGFHDDARQMEAATVHWLRHTGISDDVKIRPREHVRDDAGHGSSAITDRYIDVELRERHASSKKKQIKPK